MASKKQRFTENNVSNAPTKPGIYILTTYGEVTYIGKGEGNGGIKSRLQAAQRDTRKKGKATSFQMERCKQPSEREKQLLEQHLKRYGKLPRHNRRIG